MERLIPYFIRQKIQFGIQRGEIEALALFVDITGFTPMTERLLQHGNEGAEVLSIALNDIFEPMVALVSAHEGIIPHFAGDAFTAIFPVNIEIDDPSDVGEVIQIAHRIRTLFEEKPIYKTKFGDFNISVRIGLSQGRVDWGVVGSSSHSTYYFKGEAIDDAAAAEHHAAPQQIVCHKNFQYYVNFRHSNVVFKPLPAKISSRFYQLEDITTIARGQDAPHAPPSSVATAAEMPREASDAPPSASLRWKPRKLKESNDKNGGNWHSDSFDLSAFLPESVIHFNGKGEFREVVSLFMAFKGIEDDNDMLNTFSTILLEQFHSFGGYFKELDFGDKGAIAVGFFGAPVAFENNSTRALEFVTSVREALQQSNLPIQLRGGMTSGIAFTGMVGGTERKQYAVVGDRVNLAARLMSQADWDTILTDKNVASNRKFTFTPQGKIQYKGISSGVPTFQFVQKKADDRALFAGNMIGRANELEYLIETAEQVFATRKPCVTYIFGEAGIGKSRLSFELHQHLSKRFKTNFEWATCQSDQILKKPFNPFVYFLQHYFSQKIDHSTTQNRKEFETRFEKLVRNVPETQYTGGGELIRTKSILAALIGLTIENSLWEQLDAKGRYENTLAALSAFFTVLASEKPLVIELEDAHWNDEASNEFVRAFFQKTSTHGLPIFLIITSRYTDEGTKPYLFEPHFTDTEQKEIDLNMFSHESLRTFAEAKLNRGIHRDLLDLLWRTTNGNPFYAEQILAYFVENNLLELSDNYWTIKDKNIKISNSISSILTARIDRLSILVKETVKAAAVIGREFELPILSEIMQDNPEFMRLSADQKNVLKDQIQSAERGQIWRAMNELRYIFRHALLREAVYDMQMRTNLRQLHQSIGQAIEKIYAQNLEERFIDLAFHYEQSEDKSKTKLYLKKAGDYARRNFQNTQALEFYDRLLKIVEYSPSEMTERVKILINKGEVLQLIGKWHDSEICFHEALFASADVENPVIRGRANGVLGVLLMLKGNYSDAKMYFERALNFFEKADDQVGIAQSLGNLGNLYFRQGEYEQAEAFFNESLVQNRKDNRKTNAQIVSNLGLTYMNQGKYEEGVHVQRSALIESEADNDLLGQTILNINLGIVLTEKGDEDDALLHLEKGLEIGKNLNNRLWISIALGCIGNIYRMKGKFERATTCFEQDLSITLELGDKQGIAIAHELIARLNATKGDFQEAEKQYQKSLVRAREINYQKGIAKSLLGLGEVYSLENDFLNALKCLNEATEIAKKINNKLILGQILVEQANILIKAGDLQNAKQAQQEAQQVSEILKNQALTQQVNALVNKIN
ncbi:MAG: hypothetical protein RL757_2410 [Bacteroidota bacterium]